jgi:hypothetical protein
MVTSPLVRSGLGQKLNPVLSFGDIEDPRNLTSDLICVIWMKTTTSPLSAPFVLRIVGYILILSSLMDYIALATSIDFAEKAKLGAALTQFVDRGVIPMIGVALVAASSALETIAGVSNNKKSIPNILVMALSTLLGLVFLLSVPLHFMNTKTVADTAVEQVGKEAQKAEGTVDSQVQERQAQLAELLKDKTKFEEQMKQLNAAVASPDLPKDQLPQLQKLQKDLQEIQADPGKLQAKAQDSKNEALQQIRNQKQKKEGEIRGEAFKASMRTGLGGLMLAVGYTLIGWLGLAEIGLFSKKAR